MSPNAVKDVSGLYSLRGRWHGAAVTEGVLKAQTPQPTPQNPLRFRSAPAPPPEAVQTGDILYSVRGHG
jgi:hypothetical protein